MIVLNRWIGIEYGTETLGIDTVTSDYTDKIVKVMSDIDNYHKDKLDSFSNKELK